MRGPPGVDPVHRGSIWESIWNRSMLEPGSKIDPGSTPSNIPNQSAPEHGPHCAVVSPNPPPSPRPRPRNSRAAGERPERRRVLLRPLALAGGAARAAAARGGTYGDEARPHSHQHSAPSAHAPPPPVWSSSCLGARARMLLTRTTVPQQGRWPSVVSRSAVARPVFPLLPKVIHRR